MEERGSGLYHQPLKCGCARHSGACSSCSSPPAWSPGSSRGCSPGGGRPATCPPPWPPPERSWSPPGPPRSCTRSRASCSRGSGRPRPSPPRGGSWWAACTATCATRCTSPSARRSRARRSSSAARSCCSTSSPSRRRSPPSSTATRSRRWPPRTASSTTPTAAPSRPGGRGCARGRAELLAERAGVGRHVDRQLAQRDERDEVERALVRGGEHDVRRRAVLVGVQPVRGGHAPAIAGRQARESEERHGRDEVVADPALVLEELGGDNRADRVAATVLRAGRAAAVAVEARQRVGAAWLQVAAEDVALGHGYAPGLVTMRKIATTSSTPVTAPRMPSVRAA